MEWKRRKRAEGGEEREKKQEVREEENSDVACYQYHLKTSPLLLIINFRRTFYSTFLLISLLYYLHQERRMGSR